MLKPASTEYCSLADNADLNKRQQHNLYSLTDEFFGHPSKYALTTNTHTHNCNTLLTIYTRIWLVGKPMT